MVRNKKGLPAHSLRDPNYGKLLIDSFLGDGTFRKVNGSFRVAYGATKRMLFGDYSELYYGEASFKK